MLGNKMRHDLDKLVCPHAIATVRIASQLIVNGAVSCLVERFIQVMAHLAVYNRIAGKVEQ